MAIPRTDHELRAAALTGLDQRWSNRLPLDYRRTPELLLRVMDDFRHIYLPVIPPQASDQKLYLPNLLTVKTVKISSRTDIWKLLARITS